MISIVVVKVRVRMAVVIILSESICHGVVALRRKDKKTRIDTMRGNARQQAK
jgi:hypothetical protein